MNDFTKWFICNGLVFDADEDEQWITTKNGHHVLIDGEGEIQAGMGGKFDGQKIDKIPVKRHPRMGASPETKKLLDGIRDMNKATAQIRAKTAIIRGCQDPGDGFKSEIEKMDANIKSVADKVSQMEGITDRDRERMVRSYTDNQMVQFENKMYGSYQEGPRADLRNIKMQYLEKAMNGELKENMTPPSLAGVSRGNPMSSEEADKSNANPNYDTDPNAQINCQTCVAAYEARLRGYDVEAPEFSWQRMSGAVCEDEAAMFYDPKTGLSPDKIQIPIEEDLVPHVKASNAYDIINETVKEGERYILSCQWSSGDGHVLNVEKRDGKLRWVDAQSGEIYDDKRDWVYRLEKMVWLEDYTYLFRIDNMSLNQEVCDRLLKAKGTA